KAPVKQFLGGDIKETEANARLASPVLQLKDKAVPFLIMHGDADNVVPPGQSKEFAEALKKHNADVDYKVVKGGEHMFLTPDTMKDVVDFFDAKLKGPIEKLKDAVTGTK
ncbi:MAG: prolyl oligopeptidase family serine peptidase, partial [Leptolyngbya sp.]|nr:prolyl oligopeptidase family serine peptidase [Candidatus Melainabacteria bacterium]